MCPLSTKDFFDGYYHALEQKGWDSVILHNWKDLPGTIPSDVDYLVGRVTRDELLDFVEAYCSESGWVLAQVMEHEPDAFYCVCFMADSPWNAVKLDVAWDYQRKGRCLIPGRSLLTNKKKPAGKSFFVPEPRAEFAYVIAKGLAKSKGCAPVIARLEELWNEDPHGCAAMLEEYFESSQLPRDPFFPRETIHKILHPANRKYQTWRSRRWGPDQFSWLIRRLQAPYGMSISLNNPELCKQLAELLLPGFRRVIIQPNNSPLSFGRRKWLEYRSSLILSTSISGHNILALDDMIDPDDCMRAILTHMSHRSKIMTKRNNL